MHTTTAPRRAVVWGLVAYLVIVGVVLFSPVSYSGVVVAIWSWMRDDLGWTGFGAGWIEFSANVLMFLPLGFLLTLLLRHHWRGVALAVGLSAVAELIQVVIPPRVPSLRDVLANTLGAALGAALAWLLIVRGERRAAAREDSTRSAVHDRR